MSDKIKMAVDNFNSALKQLDEYLAEPIESKRDKAGIIQGFEFTYEQCWKLLQKLAAEEGTTANSPRSAFVYGLTNQLLDVKDEQQWIAMIKDRNLTTQGYREEIADNVVKDIQDSYKKLFDQLSQKLEQQKY